LSSRLPVDPGQPNAMLCHKALFGVFIVKDRRSLHSGYRVAHETLEKSDSTCGKPRLRFLYTSEAFELAVQTAEDEFGALSGQ
jgi:hypothetical protein